MCDASFFCEWNKNLEEVDMKLIFRGFVFLCLCTFYLGCETSGPQGFTGPRGQESRISVNQNVLGLTECPSGVSGSEFSVGFDLNGNGFLDLNTSEVKQRAVVCNGE